MTSQQVEPIVEGISQKEVSSIFLKITVDLDKDRLMGKRLAMSIMKLWKDSNPFKIAIDSGPVPSLPVIASQLQTVVRGSGHSGPTEVIMETRVYSPQEHKAFENNTPKTA